MPPGWSPARALETQEGYAAPCGAETWRAVDVQLVRGLVVAPGRVVVGGESCAAGRRDAAFRSWAEGAVREGTTSVVCAAPGIAINDIDDWSGDAGTLLPSMQHHPADGGDAEVASLEFGLPLNIGFTVTACGATLTELKTAIDAGALGLTLTLSPALDATAATASEAAPVSGKGDCCNVSAALKVFEFAKLLDAPLLFRPPATHCDGDSVNNAESTALLAMQQLVAGAVLHGVDVHCLDVGCARLESAERNDTELPTVLPPPPPPILPSCEAAQLASVRVLEMARKRSLMISEPVVHGLGAKLRNGAPVADILQALRAETLEVATRLRLGHAKGRLQVRASSLRGDAAWI
eukprot:SAG11_NODE_979_length_6319_cov_2.950322_3_plen_351_part_00